MDKPLVLFNDRKRVVNFRTHIITYLALLVSLEQEVIDFISAISDNTKVNRIHFLATKSPFYAPALFLS